MSSKLKFLLKPWFLLSINTLAVFTVVFAWKNNDGKALEPLAAQMQRSLASTSNESAFSLLYQPKEKYRYTYKFSRAIQMQAWGKAIPAVEYAGEVYLDILHVTDNGFDALVQDKIPGLNLGGDIALRINLDSKGKVLKIYSTPRNTEAEEQHQALLKDFLALWIFPLEGDTVGKYESHWEKVSSDDSTKENWRKVKVKYFSGQKKIFPIIASSENFLSWSQEYYLPYFISGKEYTRMGSANDSLEAESKYSIQFVRAELSKENWNAVLAKLTDWEEMDHLPAAATLANGKPLPKWAELLSQLRSIDTLTSSEQLEIFGDLAKLLHARADYVDELLNFLREQNAIAQGSNSSLFKIIVGALATAGTHEAQVALIKIYEEPDCPVSGKGTILAALTTTQAGLESSTRDFLANTMSTEANKDLSQGAAFALGAALQNAPNDSSKQETIVKIQNLWGQQFSAGSSLQDKLALLDVVGNSGQLDLLPQVLSVINGNTDPALQARAVFALRYMNRNDTEQIIATRMSDTSPLIREAAVNASQYSSHVSVFSQPLQNCVNGESISRIQATCRSILNTVAGAN